MRTFAEKSRSDQHIHPLQRTIRNQAPGAHADGLNRGSASAGNARWGQDFTRIPSSSRPAQRAPDGDQPRFKTWGSAGGRAGLTLDVTFSVTDTPAAGLQVIQTFMGTRRTDGLQVGTYSWKSGAQTWDAFVDGGKNSPYVTLGGNAAAHATQPYYLTADEVASQVKFDGKAGTVRIYDVPGAVAMHEEAHFETAVVAVDHKASKKDKVLKVFKWGWLGKGTKPTVAKGTEIAGAPSGISVIGDVTPEFKNIVKHDYPKYDFA